LKNVHKIISKAIKTTYYCKHRYSMTDYMSLLW